MGAACVATTGASEVGACSFDCTSIAAGSDFVAGFVGSRGRSFATRAVASPGATGGSTCASNAEVPVVPGRRSGSPGVDRGRSGA
ncbi:MAG: hypothetical protein ACXWJ3_19050, partial [Caldimonas sp.]